MTIALGSLRSGTPQLRRSNSVRQTADVDSENKDVDISSTVVSRQASVDSKDDVPFYNVSVSVWQECIGCVIPCTDEAISTSMAFEPGLALKEYQSVGCVDVLLALLVL